MLARARLATLAEEATDGKTEMHKIPVLVLTGGPCGGKTTALAYLREKLSDYGFTVFTVPEVATELITNGVTPSKSDLGRDQFQEILFREVLRREDVYRIVASRSLARKKVLICDRGIMDILAYTNAGQFEVMLDRAGFQILTARDGRYDAVFLLRTAAYGALEFYTCDNNRARTEGPEEARVKDDLILEAWNGHPHLRIIDNSTDFRGKIRRLLAQVCHALGTPVPLEIERKFLIGRADPAAFPVPVQKIFLEQAYIATAGEKIEGRVRKRAQGDACLFFETRKRAIKPGIRSEIEWPIDKTRYLNALAYERDPRFAVIRKERYCFAYKDQYFELDCFCEPHDGLWLLEIELTEQRQEILLPPFIDVVKDVTSDKQYYNRELARI